MNPLQTGGLLTKLLQIFTFNFAGAAGRLTPDAQWLLFIFFVMELIMAGIEIVRTRKLDLTYLVSKTLTAAFISWLIANWVPVTKILITGFLGAGLKAGGDVITEVDFTNPDTIVAQGFGATAVVFQALTATSVFAPKAVLVNLLAGIVTLASMACYITLAIIVFLSLLEFYGSLAITLILLPFGLISFMRWLGEKAIAHTFAGCIRVACIAFVLSLSLPLMVTASWASSDTLAAAFYTLIVAAALMALAFVINRWVQSLLHGNIAFGWQDVSRQTRELTSQITHLGNVMQTLGDLASRGDPEHPVRQPTATRRGP
jgi:P-type conjugative transfer protein TrbL